jgi:hypothetical protein
MNFARIIGFFLLLLTANAIAGQKAQYFVDDTWNGSNEGSLPHYHNPEEACVVGVMQRKVHVYQEGASLRFRYRSVSVGTDDGFSEYACQGVIEKQL